MEGNAILRIYMHGEDRYRGRSLPHALVVACLKRHLFWVSSERGLESAGSDGVVHRNTRFYLTERAPVLVEISGPETQLIHFAKEYWALIQAASGPTILLRSQMVFDRSIQKELITHRF